MIWRIRSRRKKEAGWAAVAEWTSGERQTTTFVRVSPLGGGLTDADLAAVLPGRPDGIVLPKAEGSSSVIALIAKIGTAPVPPILPIATETTAAIFPLASYGAYTSPYEIVRAKVLFGGHTAGIAAIDTVYPSLGDEAGLAA